MVKHSIFPYKSVHRECSIHQNSKVQMQKFIFNRCRFRYRSSDDSYFVGLTDPKKAKPCIRGWKSLLYSYENVKRTVQRKTNEVI